MSALAGGKARSRFAFVPPSRWVPAVRGAVVCYFARRAAGNPHRITHGLGVGWSTLVAAELIAATRV